MSSVLIIAGNRRGSLDRLLEEADYTPKAKAAARTSGKFAGLYWLLVTAVFLGWGLLGHHWEVAWIVWPLGGILFAAISQGIRAFSKEEQQK